MPAYLVTYRYRASDLEHKEYCSNDDTIALARGMARLINRLVAENDLSSLTIDMVVSNTVIHQDSEGVSFTPLVLTR